jgi:hypothetical protein
VQRFPGQSTIRLAGLDVELTGNQPLVGVDFTVEKKDMPIIYTDVSRTTRGAIRWKVESITP